MFTVGDKVRKVGGNYQADGVIVAVFMTTLNEIRYVFEFETFPGMLHIFTGNQLEARK